MGEAVELEEKSVLVADILAAQGDRVVFIDVRSIERPISRGARGLATNGVATSARRCRHENCRCKPLAFSIRFV